MDMMTSYLSFGEIGFKLPGSVDSGIRGLSQEELQAVGGGIAPAAAAGWVLVGAFVFADYLL